MAKYFLRTKKDCGTSSLYTRFQRQGLNILINTKVSVNIKDWQASQSNVSKWKNYVNTQDGKKVNDILSKIDSLLDGYTLTDNITPETIKKHISDIVSAETRQILHDKQEQEREQKITMLQEEERTRKNNILLYLDNHINNMETGIVKNKSGHKIKPATIMKWRVFRNIFTPFILDHYFTWGEINKQTVSSFVKYLEERQYLDTMINTQLSMFSTLCNASYIDEYHENNRASKLISSAKRLVKVQDKRAEIYLDENELNELYEMPLSGKSAIIRDYFLIGVYTCQRYSDYKRIGPTSIVKTARGNEVIRLIQDKTQNETIVPILNDKLRTLLVRNSLVSYKGKLTDFNNEIRRILSELSKTVRSLASLIETLPTKYELNNLSRYTEIVEANGKYYRPKWALVSSHTARRSGITNLYLSGHFNTIQMMSISGHKTQHQFLEYIKLSRQDLADEIADKMRSEKNNNICIF